MRLITADHGARGGRSNSIAGVGHDYFEHSHLPEEPMVDQGPDALVESYLNDVSQAVALLPSTRRRRVIDDVSAQIANARVGLNRESDVAVRELLQKLGTPASIASAAMAEGHVVSQRTEHRHEGAAIRWLLFGGLLFGVGWFVGVNLLWRSPDWSRNEKLLGTLVLPGGLLWAFYLAPSQVAAPSGGVSLTGWSVWGALALVLPLVSAAVLVSRRRRIHNMICDA